MPIPCFADTETVDLDVDGTGALIANVINSPWQDVAAWSGLRTAAAPAMGTTEYVMITAPNVRPTHLTNGGIHQSDVNNIAGVTLVDPADYSTPSGATEFRLRAQGVVNAADPHATGLDLIIRIRNVLNFSNHQVIQDATVFSLNVGSFTDANDNREAVSAVPFALPYDYYVVTMDATDALSAGSTIATFVRLQSRRLD